MGQLYASGTMVEKSVPEAIDWYGKAAAAGHTRAMVAIGGLYQEGSERVPRSFVEAHRWFSLAANLGDAQVEICSCLLTFSFQLSILFFHLRYCRNVEVLL